MRLILASTSPRRLELLKRIGVTPDIVVPSQVDEIPRQGEMPGAYAMRMAMEKAVTVHTAFQGALILAADTVVALGRRILPKAQSEEDARRALEMLSGRRHKVCSAVALIDREGNARKRLSVSIVAFKRLSTEEIEAYIASGEWRGKAGGYAIQGRAEALVRRLSGSHSGVMGLPLFETRAMLRTAGYPLD